MCWVCVRFFWCTHTHTHAHTHTYIYIYIIICTWCCVWRDRSLSNTRGKGLHGNISCTNNPITVVSRRYHRILYTHTHIFKALWSSKPSTSGKDGCKSLDGAWFRGFGFAPQSALARSWEWHGHRWCPGGWDHWGLESRKPGGRGGAVFEAAGVTIFKTDVIMNGRWMIWWFFKWCT